MFLLGSATRRAVDSARLPPATWPVTGNALVGVVLLLLVVRSRRVRPRAALATAVLGQQLPHRLQALALAIGGMALMVVRVMILTRSPLDVDPHGARLHHQHHHRP